MSFDNAGPGRSCITIMAAVCTALFRERIILRRHTGLVVITSALIAATLSALICGVGIADFFHVFGETLYDMRFPAITVASVVGLAFVMNASGG